MSLFLSFIDSHKRSFLLFLVRRGWPVRICRVEKDTGEAADPEREFQMPVFVYVLTKLKKLPGMQPVSLHLLTTSDVAPHSVLSSW